MVMGLTMNLLHGMMAPADGMNRRSFLRGYCWLRQDEGRRRGVDLWSLLMANLIGIASNLDNGGVGLAYGTKNIRLPHWVIGVINVVGFCATLIGTYAGGAIAHHTPAKEAQWAACVVLCGIGLFFLYSAYLKPRAARNREQTAILQKPGLKQSIALGLALSITNIGTGVGAALSNAAFQWSVVVAISLWGYVLIWLGNVIGIGVVERLFGKYSPLLAGLLLIGIGLHQVA
jgi:putative Mn2+ efflux pump MntP